MARRPKTESAGAGTGIVRDETYYATRDFKAVLARINRDGWKELKQVSVAEDKSFQQIMVEALNDYLEKHGRKPVVESRVLPKE